MFFAMCFFPSFENQHCVRSLRIKGYKTEDAARRAIERRKLQGYVKRLNNRVPVWSNVN